MLQNYFKIGIRNLLKNKTFSLINMMGLAIGIASCLLITLYVYHQLDYDRFQQNANRIVRVTMEFGSSESIRKVSVTGTKVFPAFKRAFPEVENGVRFYHDNAIVRYGEKVFDEKGFTYADSTFFSIFSFKLLAGDPATALSKPNSVILTKTTAKRYFGTLEASLGKVIRVDDVRDYSVTGVMQDCPDNSQIKFDFVAAFSSLEVSKSEEWWDANYFTYLLLSSPGTEKSLEGKITNFMNQQTEVNGNPSEGRLAYFLEPFLRVHLYSNVEGGLEPAGDYRYVYIFGAIALLILGIACANYINLTTAKAAERAREVGMRKVLGALRKQLVLQFLGESVLLVTVALLLCAIMTQWMLPIFNTLSATQLTLFSVFQPIPLAVSVCILLVIIFLGAGYPALILSKFNPSTVLKGNYRPAGSGVALRRVLIAFQFFISGGLIIATLVIRDQLDFILNKKLGYDTHQILSIPIDGQVRSKVGVLKTELSGYPAIQSVTVGSRSPVAVNSTNTMSFDNHNVIVNQIRTDKDFIKTLGIKIVRGADFTDADEKAAYDPDNKAIQSVIVNRSTVEAFHWTPEEAIGRSIGFRGQQVQVKGVMEDFHFASMHRPITPLVLFIGENVNLMMIRISGEDLPQTLEFVSKKWGELVQHRPFEFQFLDDQFNNLYTTEHRTGKIFYGFALLAIGLACLGLFGLVAFSAQQRTKEIGIRKVLGAPVHRILLLLSKDFLIMVVIALCVALPAGYYFTDQWLQGFAYHVDVGWQPFVMAAVASILIVLITVSFQTVRTAFSNPVDSLRNE